MKNKERPQRESIRLKEYDYRQPGAYYVTICTQHKKCLLGTVDKGEVILSVGGRIVDKCLTDLPKHFPFCHLDTCVIMPNHIHMILMLHCTGEAFAEELIEKPQASFANASPLHPIGTSPGSVGAIIQNLKSVTTRRVNKVFRTTGKTLWQRDYYEHVVRDEHSLEDIRRYILENPWKWGDDEYYSE